MVTSCLLRLVLYFAIFLSSSTVSQAISLTKTGRNVQYVCFGTGSLQTKQVAIVYSHPVRRRNAHTNRSYAGDGMQRQHSAVKLLHKGFLLVICDRIAIVV